MGWFEEQQSCSYCNGVGYITIDCPDCYGSGKTKETCPDCRGYGHGEDGRNVILAMVMVSSMIIVIDVVVTGKYKKNVIVEDSGVELCKIPDKYQYPPKSL